MHTKYEVSISYGSKVIAKVKVDNRQTNRTKTICPPPPPPRYNMPPIIRFGGIKISGLKIQTTIMFPIPCTKHTSSILHMTLQKRRLKYCLPDHWFEKFLGKTENMHIMTTKYHIEKNFEKQSHAILPYSFSIFDFHLSVNLTKSCHVLEVC